MYIFVCTASSIKEFYNMEKNMPSYLKLEIIYYFQLIVCVYCTIVQMTES